MQIDAYKSSKTVYAIEVHFCRYSDVILAQFYGHEHTDTFQVFYSKTEDGRVKLPIGVGFIGPSITPLNGMNPGYRVYKTPGHSDVSNILNLILNAKIEKYGSSL